MRAPIPLPTCVDYHGNIIHLFPTFFLSRNVSRSKPDPELLTSGIQGFSVASTRQRAVHARSKYPDIGR